MTSSVYDWYKCFQLPSPLLYPHMKRGHPESLFHRISFIWRLFTTCECGFQLLTPKKNPIFTPFLNEIHRNKWFLEMKVALWCDIWPASVNMCQRWDMLGQDTSQSQRSGCILSAFSLFVYLLVFYGPFCLYLRPKKILSPSNGVASFTNRQLRDFCTFETQAPALTEFQRGMTKADWCVVKKVSGKLCSVSVIPETLRRRCSDLWINRLWV